MAQRLKHLLEQRDKALAVLTEKLDDGTIGELWRMGLESSRPDGFPARTLGDGGSSGSDETSSTEDAALYGLPEGSAWTPAHGGIEPAGGDVFTDRRFQADPLRDSIAWIWTQLAIATFALVKIGETLEATGEAIDAARAAEGKNIDPETCAECGHRIYGKLHRIDGAAYHDGAGEGHKDCYKFRQRERRKASGQDDSPEEHTPVTEAAPVLEAARDFSSWPPPTRTIVTSCPAGHRCCVGQPAVISTDHATKNPEICVREHWFTPLECARCLAIIDVHVSTPPAA